MLALTGMMGGFMSTLIEPIRVGLQESVRRVSVRVTWDELGRPEQSFDVIAYLTDPAKLDLAMGGPPPGATGGAGGNAGAGGTGGTAGAAGAGAAGRTGAAGGAGGATGSGRPAT